MSARVVSCVVDHLNGSKICRPSVIISTWQQFSVKIGKINHCLQFTLTLSGKKKTSLFTAIDIFTSLDEIFPTLPTVLRNKFWENLISSFKDQSIFQIYTVSVQLTIDPRQAMWAQTTNLHIFSFKIQEVVISFYPVLLNQDVQIKPSFMNWGWYLSLKNALAYAICILVAKNSDNIYKSLSLLAQSISFLLV